MEKRVATMMLAFGRCRRLVVVTIGYQMAMIALMLLMAVRVSSHSFWMFPLLLLLRLVQDVIMMPYVVVVVVAVAS